MCINYIPTTKAELVEYFGVDDPIYDWEEEVWQDYQAPILIQHDGQRQALIASYGLVPKRKVQPSSKHYATMNARAETVGEKPTYRRAWKQGHLCLVPMTGFFEPCYESGKAERWRISMVDGRPFAVAGIWYLVSGIWYLVSGIWYLVSGERGRRNKATHLAFLSSRSMPIRIRYCNGCTSLGMRSEVWSLYRSRIMTVVWVVGIQNWHEPISFCRPQNY